MEECSQGDAVLVRAGANHRAAIVTTHCSVDGIQLSLLNPMEMVSFDRVAGYAVWAPCDYDEWTETSHILTTVIHREMPDGNFGILMPYGFR